MTKKLYQFEENFRGGTLTGVFACEPEELQRVYGKDLYLGECLGKHSEVTLRFSEGDFEVMSEDAAFIEQFENIFGYIGYNPFSYIPAQWVVKYDFGNVDGEYKFDDEDEAHELYEELCEQAEGNDEASVEIHQEDE